MRIGIDMLGVQSTEGRHRESGRYGRQLVSALLAGEPDHRYVLYAHEGLPTDRIPSARHAARVSLAPKAGGSARLRPTIQRVLDQNPDGLDWLVLLDPFEPNYGGMPPEAPLNDLRVASLVLDLAPCFADDRRLVPLRRHDAILAASDGTASECRRRLGPASGRVTTLGLAAESSRRTPDDPGPLTRLEAAELGRLGIAGPYLLANVAEGCDRSDLGAILDAYQRLPVEARRTHQLVIAGRVEDPWNVFGGLHARGCAEGLVLVGEVDERASRTLHRRSAAFVSPTTGVGSGLAIVEAICHGSAVVAGRSGAGSEIVGDAGLLVDPSDPAEVAEQVARLLSDAGLVEDLRVRARARSSRFSWRPVVEAFLGRLVDGEGSCSCAQSRGDRGHSVRPRIALFPDLSRGDPAGLDLATQVPDSWRSAYTIDLYLEPGEAAGIDRVPAEFGGFDARQFDRNDEILSYHAVVYHFGDAEGLELKLGRLRSRPGLVFLPAEEIEDGLASGQLREVFLTSSRVVARSRPQYDRIKAILPEFADQLVEIPPGSGDLDGLLSEQIERCSAELGRRPGHRPIVGRPRRSTGTSRARPLASMAEVPAPGSR